MIFIILKIKMKSFIIGLILINAIFDLFSSLFKNFNLHSIVFNDNDDNDNRFLKYWVMTNGFIRLFIIFNNIYANYIIIITYIIEIFVFNYEYFIYNSVKLLNTIFISISSFILIFLILFIFQK